MQLVTLLCGVALATALWSAVQAINAEARASYATANRQLALGQFEELRAPNGSIPLSRYVELRRAGWQLAAVLDGNLRVEDRYFRVMGADLVSYPALAAIEEAQQNAAIGTPAEALTEPGLLFVRPDIVEMLNRQPHLPPVYPSEAVPPDLILTDIGVAEKILNKVNEISRLVILPDQPMGLQPLSELAPDLERISSGPGTDTAQLTESFHLNLTAFGLLSFAVGLFIVHGTIGLALSQRRGMIRTLRALGVPLELITGLVATELLFLSFAGGGLGLVLGYWLAGALLPDVAATLRGLYDAPVEGQMSLRPEWVVSGIGMAVGGTLVASTQGLWKLARLPLLSAPGEQAWRGAGNAQTRSAVIGAALVAAGVAPVVLFDGLWAGFVLLAGLLLGVALMLPFALSRVLILCARTAKTPITQWVWADLQAQLPGLALALMALLLALAANIGVGTMVSSFRLTFDGWLDQRLTSELYVTALDDNQGQELGEWLATRADAVLPIRRFELRHETGPLFLYGIIDHPTYRQKWPLISADRDVWDKVATGTGVLVNEQLARRGNLWPGDTLILAPDWAPTVTGVYSDYGNPTGQAIISMERFEERFPNAPNRRFGVRIAPELATELARSIRTQFDLPDTSVIHQAALKEQSRAIFEKTFVVTAALNILTLGVAGFAILTSLLTLWGQRLPQVAPVWALGLSRQNLAGLELIRSVVLAALTAILALPLGLLLAWILLTVINVEAFGWRLPMYLFPSDWLLLSMMALLAAALAAVIPALRLYRLPPSDLLKVFANER